MYGAFVWARRALNSPKRRFPARADGSGELSYSEVKAAVQQMWPDLPESEMMRAFKIADEDQSGLISEIEFIYFIGFV